MTIVNMRQRVKYNDYYPLGTPWVDSVVFIMAGKIIDREKYGGIYEHPPIYCGHNIPDKVYII